MRKSITKLHIRFGMKKNYKVDPFKFELLPRYRGLEHLTVFGWPVNQIYLNFCEEWMKFLGADVQRLRFLETSPKGIIRNITNICKSLLHLHIDGLQNDRDSLSSIRSSLLESLELRHTGLQIRDFLNLERLISLVIVERNSMNLFSNRENVVKSILYLPPVLRSLEMR
jgi:hypothetical protein